MGCPTFHFITLFPETIDSWLKTSMMGRALRSKLFDYTVTQLRDYTTDKHRSVDDVAYGGGGGMVFKVEPLVKAIEFIKSKVSPVEAVVVYFTPVGTLLAQPLINKFKTIIQNKHLILVCGHYEGVDQRFIDYWVDYEISIGDYVITGGELPALIFTDALVRQLEGVLGNSQGAENESFQIQDEKGTPLLEYPHYTRPPEFQGKTVPEILLTGNHAEILRWRREQAKILTQKRRM